MLESLKIENIAIIEQAFIAFGQGLNVLTGETGAGKSILIDAINAVLGGRSPKDMIRSGQSRAFVEAVFAMGDGKHEYASELSRWFEENGMDEMGEESVIVSREIHDTGRTVSRVNGRAVTLAALKKLGEALIDMHGQHENQALMNPETHILYLDRYAGREMADRLAAYTALYVEYTGLEKQIRDLTRDARDRERESDILAYEINEIRQARLQPGEDEILRRRVDLLTHASRIQDTLGQVLAHVKEEEGNSPGIRMRLADCMEALKQIDSFDPVFSEWIAVLETMSWQLDDLAEGARRRMETLDVPSGALEAAEDRLEMIKRLKRKYGDSIDGILRTEQQAAEKQAALADSDERLEQAGKVWAARKAELTEMAAGISDLREKTAASLGKAVMEQLDDLAMNDTRFQIQITRVPDGLGASGMDTVEFMISPNPGEPLKPLYRIASGGELSRIMLAVKTVLAGADRIPTLVFDEIDMGISGKTAIRVAEKLSFIASEHQVVCVTHLAQIAAYADYHYLVEKNIEKDHTTTRVTHLKERSRLMEIARLLDGALSEIAVSHAAEMLDQGGSHKLVRQEVGC